MDNKKLRRTSQSFTVEFMLALLIFSSTIVLSVKMISNIYNPEDFNNLMKESELLSDNLLSEGYPTDWPTVPIDDVIRVGLLENKRLSTGKLLALYNISYYDAKTVLGINKEFFLYFTKKNSTINLFYIINASNSTITSCGYGHPDVNQTYDGTKCVISLSNVKYKNLVKLSRLTVYDSTIITMNINVWDK